MFYSINWRNWWITIWSINFKYFGENFPTLPSHKVIKIKIKKIITGLNTYFFIGFLRPFALCLILNTTGGGGSVGCLSK